MEKIELQIPAEPIQIEIVDKKHEGRPINSLELFIETSDTRISVATGYGDLSRHFPSMEHAIAYFHLFAAAHDLLSALIKAVEYEAYDQSVVDHEANDIPDWYTEAKAAIAKATNTAQP